MAEKELRTTGPAEQAEGQQSGVRAQAAVAREQARQLGSEAREAFARGQQQVAVFTRENAFIVAGAAFALGVVVGALLRR